MLRNLLKNLRECASEAAFVSDARLASVLESRVALTMEVRATVEAELLCRLWLYGRNSSPGVLSALLDHTAPRLAAAVKGLPPDLPRAGFGSVLAICGSLDPEQACTLRKFKERKDAFERAHGLIPVVDACGEAFPIPFRLEGESGVQAGAVIMDAACREVSDWNRRADGLRAALGNKAWRLNLCCVQPADKNLFEGGSFALPVWLAACLLDRGVSALEWLASGAISEGRLRSVQQVDAKQRLAEKLRVKLWLTVDGDPSRPGGVYLSQGTPLREALGCVEEALEKHGVVQLSEASVVAQAHSLDAQVERKSVDYSIARERACKWRDWLDAEGKKNRPAYLKTLVILAAIDNHSGNAARADACFREIEQGHWRHSVLDRYKAVNQFVVSLSDRMMLDEAEPVARRLLEEIESAPFGSEEDYLRSKVGAAGALGGEVLLFKALGGTSAADEKESLQRLEEAAQCALQLIKTCGASDSHRYQYSKSLVRTALWTALFNPRGMAEAEARVRADLEAVAAADPVSLAFLCRHRLLAAYRLWNLYGVIEPAFPAFEVVEPRNASDLWLKATSLKYRGTLFFASGEVSKATADFKQAAELLSAADGPLIHLIHFSVLLQANELFEDAGRKPLFEDVELGALMSRIPGDWFAPFYLDGWIRRRRRDRCVDPQKAFAY
jgi:hypothetical protein